VAGSGANRPAVAICPAWLVTDAVGGESWRYELLHGQLLVSPAPVVKHQRAARGVFRALDAACPPELEVFFAPVDWQPECTTSFQPDVLVIRDVAPEAKTSPTGWYSRWRCCRRPPAVSTWC
jgi:Uma2 family endonuclease